MNIRRGTVSTYSDGMMRVYYQDTGQTSAELPVYFPFGCIPAFKPDEQVVVLSMNNSESIVLGKFNGNITIDDTDINWIKQIPSIEARLRAVEAKV